MLIFVFFKSLLICLNKLNENEFKKKINKLLKKTKINKFSDHVVLETADKPNKVLDILKVNLSEVSLVGYGKSINILSKQETQKILLKILIYLHFQVHMALVIREWQLKVR